MAARQPVFELYTDRKRRWRWRLRASNGKIIAASSEAYGERRKAVRGIEIVREATVAGVRDLGAPRR